MSSVNYDELMQPVIHFLGCSTPQAWLDEAVNNLDILMQDHANCEKKAAGTAMNLMFRYSFFTDLQVKLAQLVREEMLHYEQVLEFMTKRGQEWKGLSAGRYAGELRKEIRTYEPEALIDVMIIGAFVEARSCERFHALIPYIEDAELAKFYTTLVRSEARHFEDYLRLAQLYGGDISKRASIFLAIENEFILATDTVFRFHSGIPEN